MQQRYSYNVIPQDYVVLGDRNVKRVAKHTEIQRYYFGAVIFMKKKKPIFFKMHKALSIFMEI